MLPMREIEGGIMMRTGREERNKGTMTLEASVIIPIILFLVAGAILLYLTIGKRESIRGEYYTNLYTISLAEERSRTEDQLKLSGAVYYLDRVDAGNFAAFQAEFPVQAERERDKCASRLRRWQFYGDITEE